MIIESRDGVEVMTRHDGDHVCHYVDPPNVAESRSDTERGYAHEMNQADHERLLACLKLLRGSVIVSGYASELYDDELTGWRRLTREVRDQAKGRKTEVLWISPAAIERTRRDTRQMSLFA